MSKTSGWAFWKLEREYFGSKCDMGGGGRWKQEETMVLCKGGRRRKQAKRRDTSTEHTSTSTNTTVQWDAVQREKAEGRYLWDRAAAAYLGLKPALCSVELGQVQASTSAAQLWQVKAQVQWSTSTSAAASNLSLKPAHCSDSTAELGQVHTLQISLPVVHPIADLWSTVQLSLRKGQQRH